MNSQYEKMVILTLEFDKNLIRPSFSKQFHEVDEV